MGLSALGHRGSWWRIGVPDREPNPNLRSCRCCASGGPRRALPERNVL